MKHLLSAIATVVLAALVNAAPAAAGPSISYAVYQTARPTAPGSCPSANPLIAPGQSASFSGLAAGLGTLTDTICFAGPVGTANATDSITGGTWNLGGQGINHGIGGTFCPAGTIHWDASGLRAIVIAPATVGASTCGAAVSAMMLTGTWSRSSLTPTASTFVGTLTLAR